MGRAKWFVRRLVQLLIVAIGSTLVVFILIRLAPGSPAQALLGFRATPEAIEQFNIDYGLDQPLPLQYLHFLGQLTSGNLGQSLFFGEPVTEVISARLGPTIWLLILGFLMSTLGGVPLAMLAAMKHNSWIDHIIRAVPLLGFAMPAVWLAIMLILVFAVRLGWFPVGGYGIGFYGQFRSMFLPSLVLAFILMPILIRSLRASLLDVLRSDFIATARAKGLSERRVVLRHALRNALPSSVTIMALNVSALIGGAVIAETVFAVPGIGQLLAVAVLNRDFPVVQGVTLLMAFTVLAVYLATDFIQALIDPRIRLQ